MSDQQSRYGDYRFSTVVGAYEPRLEEMLPKDGQFGVPLQSQYLYGGFRATDGSTFVVERKFNSSMTSGLWLMSTETGLLELVPGSVRSTRGEAVRHFTPERRHWADHLMHKVGKDLAPEGEQGLDITIDNASLDWQEGDLLSLRGPLVAQGMQFFAPMRDEPLMYASQPYWVKGTVLGKEVEGAVYFDHLYFQHGVEWKEYRWYTDIQVSWNVFGNLFEDGSFEWGHIVRGRQGFAAGIVIGDDGPVAMSSQVPCSFELDDQDFVARAGYGVGDHQWEFLADPDGRMGGFNRARWGGYRAQGGVTRRKGDSRRLANGWTWLECFADRIRGEGLLKD